MNSMRLGVDVIRILLIPLMMILISGAYAGSIYKCMDENGRIVFKDKPCGAMSKTMPVLTGRGGSSTIGQRRSALNQLESLKKLRGVQHQSSRSYEDRVYGNRPPRQNELSYDEKLQLRNNRVSRGYIRGPHADRRLRSLDREDEAIRGREYVPDPEPIIINNNYGRYIRR